jgi:hypothetical protein
MNTRHALRRFASFAFVLALFAVSASSTFASAVNLGDISPDAEFIIIVGG